jgi:hypothetical protein
VQSRVEDLLPPGALGEPLQPAPAPPLQDQMDWAARVGEDFLPRGAVAAPAAPTSPPSADAPAEIEALLPPGATAATAAPFAVGAGPPASDLDALLPPGAVGSEAIVPARVQVPIPTAPRKSPAAATNLPAGAIAVPTPDGGFVTVRETPKTIGHGDEAIEVRRLSPDEKARRRLRNNLVMGSFCLLVIVVVVVVLLWRS